MGPWRVLSKAAGRMKNGAKSTLAKPFSKRRKQASPLASTSMQLSPPADAQSSWQRYTDSPANAEATEADLDVVSGSSLHFC